MQQPDSLVDVEALLPGFKVGDRRRDRRVEAVEVEGDVDRLAVENLADLGDHVLDPAAAEFLHGHDVVAVVVGWLEPVQRARVAAQTDLHRMGRIDLPLIGEVGAPVCG